MNGPLNNRAATSAEHDSAFDLDALLHPASAYAHPSDVGRDADLTLNEKRAILASWASDACAIEAAPELRAAPGAGRPVRFDDVMDALRTLDRLAGERPAARSPWRKLGDIRERLARRRPRSGDSGGSHAGL